MSVQIVVCENLTKYYLKNAMPGKGTITYEDGFDKAKFIDEMKKLPTQRLSMA